MKVALIAVPLVALTACAATPLQPAAEAVRITTAEPAGCKHVGDITGAQGGWFSGGMTSSNNLETGARNDLKNRAAAMGGNVVVILTHDTSQYLTGQKHNVTLTGTVYRCAP